MDTNEELTDANFKNKKASIVTIPAAEASLLAAVVESSDDAIVGDTLDALIVSWNKGAERQYGFTAEEALGKPASLIIPKDREGELSKFHALLQKGESIPGFETQRLHKSGRLIDVSLRLSPLRNFSGDVIGTIAIAHDITESKKMLFYARSVIEAGLDPMITISPEGKVTDVNEAKVKITGVPREQLIGSDFKSYFTDPEEALRGYQQVFKEGFIREFPLVIRHASGALTDVLFNASVYKDDKGNVFGMIAALRDVTESKKVLFYARSVIEAGLDPMVTISPEGKVTDVNEATVHMTGVPREKLIGSDFVNYFNDPDEARRGYEQVFREGFVREYPLMVQHISGALTDVLFNASVYKDDKGNVFGMIAAVRDIAAQKKVEEKLHETSAYARSLIEASLDPLFIISPEGKITGVNRATEGVTGVTREWLIDTDFYAYFTEPHKAQASYRQVLKEGEVRDFPLSIHNASGKITDVSFNASVYKDATGIVRGIFAVARDVTETKKVSQYSRSLIEASQDPLVTISTEGKITDTNEAAIKITGTTRESLIGTVFSTYFTEPQKAHDAYEQAFKEGLITDYPLTIKSKDGKLTDVLYNASVYKDDKGNVLGVTAVARDVTKAKETSDQAAAANKELEAFSYSVSHDLRAPLRAIDGFVKVLATEYASKLDDEGKRIVGIIDKNTIQMGKLIDDLLSFSRLGRKEIKKEYVDMGPMVKKLCDEQKALTPTRDATCTIGELPEARADEDMIRVVWTNLLSNAFKYTGKKEKTVIEIGGKAEGDTVTYFVKDNGVGFDMKYVEKLFGVFQRLHSEEEFAGTGIGLANVKRIIERHGGKAWAEGEVDKGATFYFTLPKI